MPERSTHGVSVCQSVFVRSAHSCIRLLRLDRRWRSTDADVEARIEIEAT
jgi:hypothetical protein